MMRKTTLALLLALSGTAHAGETLEVCFNYGCAQRAEVTYSDEQLNKVRDWLQSAPDAADERRILAGVMGKLYRWAGEQSPISADMGGNAADGEAYGRMDCIDHTTTTTDLLKMLENHGWLRFHRVSETAKRTSAFGLLDHYAATIEERPSRPGAMKLSTRLTGLPTDPPPDDSPEALSDAGMEDAQALAEVFQSLATARARFVVDTWFHDNGEPAEIMPLSDWLEGGGPDV